MSWKEIDSLKKLDKIDIDLLKKEVFQDLSAIFDTKKENHEDLLQFIRALSIFSNQDKGLFFISDDAKYIYILTQLDGEARRNALGITSKMMTNKNEANKWRTKINLIIHTDRCVHPLAEKACQQSEQLYEDMIRA